MARYPWTERISTLVRDKRKQTGLSLRDCQEETGISYSMLARIERGESGMNVNTLHALSRWCGVSMDELMEGGRP